MAANDLNKFLAAAAGPRVVVRGEIVFTPPILAGVRLSIKTLMVQPRPARGWAAQDDDDPLFLDLRAAFSRAQDPLAPHAMRQLHRTVRQFVSAKCGAGWKEDDIIAAVLRVGAVARRPVRLVEEDGYDGFADLVLQSAVLHAKLRLRHDRRPR